jgi:phenylalanyl-tRNA synthetase beta chain
LDGAERELSPSNLVIADTDKPLAVAGIMGGEGSGITDETTTIVFEAATFDPVSVRRTGRALNVHSDSSLRFEKGLPEELTSAALARAVELCQKIACGRVASAVVDLDSAPTRKSKYVFRPEKAEQLIGVKVPQKEMVGILKSLGFGVALKGGKGDVTVPYWRVRDIEDERDLAEEIARVHGYHNLPSVIPTGEIPLDREDPLLETEERTRHFFRAAGLTELYTYSFISKDLLEKAGLDASKALKVANELTADFEFMRPSLIPGALQVIRENQGLFPEGRVFEVSRAYFPREGDLPEERTNVMAAVFGKAKDDSLFRQVKGLLESYCPMIGAAGISFKRLTGHGLWHPGRSVVISVDGTTFGTMGEIHPSVLSRFGIDGRVAMLDFDLAALMDVCHATTHYVPVPQFPPVLRDLAFVVPERAEYDGIRQEISRASALLKDASLFDVYRGKGVGEGDKSLALHLTFAEPTRTLTAEEADGEIKKIVDALKEKFDASVRS